MKEADEESNLFPFRRRVLGILLNLSVFVCFHIEEARNFLILIAENNKTMSECLLANRWEEEFQNSSIEFTR